ncbi:flagellar biosynthetic protein FliO [Brumicola pallidula]|uniref:Flagellar protein n=1 Tax=Brumicola pallidula DSM 14239 = ACAM 615 TaxID=1121922 RepID=K6Y2U9_9ALTE|nr:flagellar biosynthetic protein FliO [Glaciecola pallidula]GAC27144.1 flagellar protein FliO/FliZ [Glaciecola pallidula DSM 14239 = ACAM 615]
MLLVKSRELKNLDRNLYKTSGYTLFLFLFSSVINAEASASSPQTLQNPSSILSIFLSLLLVVAIIFALAFIARRFNVTQAGNGQLKVIASMAAGAKEKIMVVDVGGEQFLIGVTAHNINQLGKLDNPIATPSTSRIAGQPASLAFKDKLVKAMAETMIGAKKEKAHD